MAPRFGEAEAETLFTKMTLHLNTSSPGPHDTEFNKASFAMLDALYMIRLDPQVLTNGKAEGERVGKLLRKYTTRLKDHKCEEMMTLVNIVMMKQSAVYAIDHGFDVNGGRRLEVLFWEVVLENYKD